MDLKELLGDAYKDGMTVEEVAEAIKGKNLVDQSTLPPTVSKDVFDKTASELAALKREAKEKMTAEEQSKAQQQEFLERMAALEKENVRMKQEKAFLTAGYSAETAATLAGHVVDGNTEEFVRVQTEWISEQKKAIYAQTKQELLNQTAGMHVGTGAAPQEDVDFATTLGKSRQSSTGNQQEVLKHYAK